jgi:hypothetical protein
MSRGEKKIVEVDEEQWIRSQNIVGQVAKIWNSNQPEAKLLVQRAQKMVDPAAITPELDRFNERQQADKGLQDKVAALEAQIAKDKADREAADKLNALKTTTDAQLAKIKRDQRLTDEGMAAVRKIMEDEGILNAEAAYALWERRNPPAAPGTPGGIGGSWNFLDVGEEKDAGHKYAKALLETKGRNDAVLSKEVFAALNEIRGQRAAA